MAQFLSVPLTSTISHSGVGVVEGSLVTDSRLGMLRIVKPQSTLGNTKRWGGKSAVLACSSLIIAQTKQETTKYTALRDPFESHLPPI